jgi:hypothetical protein
MCNRAQTARGRRAPAYRRAPNALPFSRRCPHLRRRPRRVRCVRDDRLGRPMDLTSGESHSTAVSPAEGPPSGALSPPTAWAGTRSSRSCRTGCCRRGLASPRPNRRRSRRPRGAIRGSTRRGRADTRFPGACAAPAVLGAARVPEERGWHRERRSRSVRSTAPSRRRSAVAPGRACRTRDRARAGAAGRRGGFRGGRLEGFRWRADACRDGARSTARRRGRSA